MTAGPAPPLVLWDLDGTLLRAGGVSRDAFAAAVGDLGDLGPDLSFAGRTDPWIAHEVLTRAGRDPALAPEVLRRYADELAARAGDLARTGRVLPGAREALAALAGRGARQGVVTGNLAVTARVKLAALDLLGHLDLDGSAFGDDGATRDDLVPVALRRAGGVPPERAWVVGDTPHDLQCARAAGVRCLLVATGGYDLDALSALGADAVLPDLTGAADVLLG